MKSFFNIVSLNRRYVPASLVYLGMTVMLLCAIPEIILYARDGEEPETACTHTVFQEDFPVTLSGCPTGYICCELSGECVEIE